MDRREWWTKRAVALTVLVGVTLAGVVGAQSWGQKGPPSMIVPASAVNGAGVARTSLLLSDGTAAAPSLAFADIGLYRVTTTAMGIAFGNALRYRFSASGFDISSDSLPFRFGLNNDLRLQRDAAGVLALNNLDTPTDHKLRVYSAGGAYSEHGVASELLTISTSASTDTTASLLPANAVIDSVNVYVVTVIPTAATFTVGDATIAARFATGVSTAATTAAIGLSHVDQTGTSGPRQTAAAKVRITPNASPGAATGQVRVSVFYHLSVAGTG